jgi:hypothetical protein
MKILRYLGWCSLIVAVIILIIAFIDFFVKAKLFAVAHGTSYFILANSLLLIAIALFIATKHCHCDECECKDEKKSS